MLNSLYRPAFLLHPNWLAAALSTVVFLQFAMNRGGSDQAIWVAGFFLAVQAIGGTHHPPSPPHRALFLLGVAAFLLLLSWSFCPIDTDTHSSLRIVRFAILVLAVHHLGHRGPDRGWLWVALLASGIVFWQLAARHIAGHPFGTFDNPHYLAFFSSLLLPVLALLTVRLSRPYRWFMAAILLLNFDPIINILWAPTIPLLANGAALAVVIWSIASRRVRWGLAISVTALVAVLLFFILERHLALAP